MGTLVAEFLPLDMNLPRELLTEDEIVAQLTLNDMEAERAPDDEEKIALRALRSKTRSGRGARTTHARMKA